MRVKLILPALAEAGTPAFRPIKYSLFPPLGLGTLAGYLAPDDEVAIIDEHINGRLEYADTPDLVGIEVYVTSARRSYAIADAYRKRGVHVVLGGLHPTSLPEEALEHADTVITGPAEEAWPRFLADFRAGRPERCYVSQVRTLEGLPPIRRDLWNRALLSSAAEVGMVSYSVMCDTGSGRSADPDPVRIGKAQETESEESGRDPGGKLYRK